MVHDPSLDDEMYYEAGEDAQRPTEQSEGLDRLVSRCTARLQESGVFKGAHGLEGLAESNEFWEQQPYGTRLYYGDGITEYLHRDVIRAAIKILNG
ncbi:MAG: hypothetical protein M9918_24595 [Anaerolineae bacterium]|nr:hypothetical protein [Anaerolineae bacterium]